MNASETIRVLGPYVSEARRARIDAVLAARLRSVTVIMEDTHEPHNAAAVLRTSEAFGVGQVHIIEDVEMFEPSKRVAQGSAKWLDLHRYGSAEAAIEILKAKGFRIAGADPEADLTLSELPVDAPLALFFGNEHRGISATARSRLDLTYRIPQYGFVQSMNVSVAVAITIADVTRRRRLRLETLGDLDEATRTQLRARFYQSSVVSAEALLRRAEAPV